MGVPAYPSLDIHSKSKWIPFLLVWQHTQTDNWVRDPLALHNYILTSYQFKGLSTRAFLCTEDGCRSKSTDTDLTGLYSYIYSPACWLLQEKIKCVQIGVRIGVWFAAKGIPQVFIYLFLAKLCRQTIVMGLRWRINSLFGSHTNLAQNCSAIRTRIRTHVDGL
jgi:hypothetical protein